MRYLKTYETYKEQDVIVVTESEFQILKERIMDDMKKLGFDVHDSSMKDLRKNFKSNYENVHMLLFKFNCREVEYSILWFLTQALLDKRAIENNYRVELLSSIYLDPITDKYITINISPNNTISAEEAYTKIVSILIEHINTAHDTRLVIGDNSRNEYPIFKKVILGYLNSLLNKSDLDKEIFTEIKNYISNSQTPNALFNLIQKTNPYLFSKMEDKNTINAAELGERGFDD